MTAEMTPEVPEAAAGFTDALAPVVAVGALPGRRRHLTGNGNA
jgi:hypothetical protein